MKENNLFLPFLPIYPYQPPHLFSATSHIHLSNKMYLSMVEGTHLSASAFKHVSGKREDLLQFLQNGLKERSDTFGVVKWGELLF